MNHKKISLWLVIAISILFSLICLKEALPQESAEELYEAAIFKKEAEGDLGGAIQRFLKIITAFPDNRKMGAKAQLQIGMCYEKTGMKQALKAYQKVAESYPEQTEEIKLATEKIAILLKAQALVEKGDREFKIRQVWSGPDVDIFGGPSPDGRYLSYVDGKTGDLAIHELATGKKRRLTHEATWKAPKQFAFYSKISPDGKQIAYSWYNQLSDKNFYYDLRLIGIDGSSPRILYSNKDYEVYPAQWSSDGKHIAVRMYGRKDKKFRIAWISVKDGSIRVLKISDIWQTTQDCVGHSPDDRYIAFDLPVKEDSGKYDIYLLATDGSGETPLIEHSANDKLLGWAPGGKEVIFISDRTGTLDLWLIQVENGRRKGSPRWIKSEIGKVFPLGFKQDGSFFFSMSRSWSNSYIASIDLAIGKVKAPLKQPFLGSNFSPQWSADSEYIAYILEQLKPAGPAFFKHILHVRSLKTGKDREVPCELNYFKNPRWSPDGRSILVTSFYKKDKIKDYVGGLYKIDVHDGKVTLIAPYAPGIDDWAGHRGEWSKDGKAIFYVNRGCILRREIESGLEQQLYCDPNLFSILALSPDGQKLLFDISDPKKGTESLLIMPISGEKAGELLRLKEAEFIKAFAWSSDGKHVLFTKAEEYGTSLWQTSSEGGEPQMLWQTDKKTRGLHVHPDGHQIAFHTYTQAYEVWVMENFLPKLNDKH
jgi:Tol biopolymer transport system component